MGKVDSREPSLHDVNPGYQRARVLAGETRAVETRRVLMVAGGTGGHVFPALAVADELRARSLRAERCEERGRERPARRYSVEFLGTKRGLDTQLLSHAGFSFRTISGAGLKGLGAFQWIQNLLVLPRSAIETSLVLRETQPDVVMGMGGYIAGPAMLEASLQDIPTILMEPNALPGFTNRVLAPVVRVAALGFEDAARFYGAKACVTGHPVRRAFFEIPPKPHAAPFTVLIFGGSQGAAAINACIVKALPLFSERAARWRLIHQTGERDYNEVRKAYQDQSFDAEVYAFIENMPAAFARADVIISRAGANSVAELAAAGKAAILIPFPGAADQHQLQNARTLERVGAAQVIEQKDLTPERLVTVLDRLLSAPRELEAMEQRVRVFARPDAAANIADLIEHLAR